MLKLHNVSKVVLFYPCYWDRYIKEGRTRSMQGKERGLFHEMMLSVAKVNTASMVDG